MKRYSVLIVIESWVSHFNQLVRCTTTTTMFCSDNRECHLRRYSRVLGAHRKAAKDHTAPLERGNLRTHRTTLIWTTLSIADTLFRTIITITSSGSDGIHRMYSPFSYQTLAETMLHHDDLHVGITVVEFYSLFG